MWLKQGLDATPITADKLQFVKNQVGDISNAVPANAQKFQGRPDHPMAGKKTSTL
jgi:hypothetical protein